MGNANVTAKYSDGYKSFTAYATIKWDSTPTVSISNVTGDNTAFYWRIVLQGDSTKKFVADQSASVTSASFSGTFGTSYVFQACGSNKTWNNDGDSVFTVTKDSGSSSGGGSTGGSDPKYITITQNDGTKLTVYAWLPVPKEWRQLKNGDKLTNSMQYISVKCTAEPGYYLKTYSLDNGDAPVGFKYSGLTPHSETIGGKFAYSYTGDVRVTSAAHPLEYTLSLSQGIGSLITVTRISSVKSSASTDIELHDGDTIYHFDELQISFNADAGYTLTTYTVNGESFTSGNTLQVSGNVSIASEAIVQAYKLSLNLDTGSTAIVNRTSSPLQNAPIGELDNNAIIYYSDVLVVNTSSRPEYKIVEQYINDDEFMSGDSFEIQSDIHVRTVTELRGIVHIYKGSGFEQYLIYIYHNGSWGQYIPYVYKDSKWNICS